jgi:hypothetical protein
MFDFDLDALFKIVIYFILFCIVSVLIFSHKRIKNLHVVMVFILFLVLILKNSIEQN